MDEIELSKELIRFETTTPVEDESIMTFLEGLLRDEGIEAEIHDIDGVKNLTATIGDGDVSICFNGHLDVVDPGSGWEVTDPFQPRVEEGRLYGRGAADMKAGLAAQVMAFLDLSEDPDFDGELTLMAVGDEEVGGFNGTKRLVEEFEPFDYAIIGEPTDLDVQVGTRGILWIDVYLRGESIHASRPHLVHNIMEDVPAVLDALNDFEMEYEPDDMLPDPLFNVTVTRTRKTQNSIPGEARIGVDCRYLPDQDTDAIVAAVRRRLEELDIDAEIEIDSMDHGGAFKLTDDTFKQVAVGVMDEIRDENPAQVTDGGASDGRFFAERGTPFIELGVNQKPGHQADEHCRVANISKLRRAYREIAKRLAE